MFILSIDVTVKDETIMGQHYVRKLYSGESADELVRQCESSLLGQFMTEIKESGLEWKEIMVIVQEVGPTQDSEQYAWWNSGRVNDEEFGDDVFNSMPSQEWEDICERIYSNTEGA